MQHFVYLWLDRARRMFYVGSHSGTEDDGYISSSKWFTGEVVYRPNDFIRRILSVHDTAGAMLTEEHRLLAMIKDHEFGTKYYNRRIGRKKGCVPANKGIPMTTEQKIKISLSKKGCTSPTKGMKMPHRSGDHNTMSNPNNRNKLSASVTGRMMVIDSEGRRRWASVGDPDYPA